MRQTTLSSVRRRGNPAVHLRFDMSPAILGLSAAIAALILAPVVIWFWINRATKVARIGPSVLPLFTGSGMTIAKEERDEADGDGIDHVRAARDAANRVARSQLNSNGPIAKPNGDNGNGSGAHGSSGLPPSTRQAPVSIPKAAAMPTPRRTAALEHVSYSAPRPSPTIRTFDPSRPFIVSDDGTARAPIDRQIIPLNLPTDGTLQFLPGRLEVVSGEERGREIRFVRLPGLNGADFTFGRSEGELYRHIQLHDQTVSRQHARMRFHEGRWYLLSLSHTNPVIHVGRALAVGEEHALDDGDRIEMGEVLCTFRNR